MVLDAYEPDNSYPEAKTIISGVQQVHSINPAGDNDWVTFTLTDYADIILETSGSGEDDTVLYIYDSTGTNQIGYNDDGAFNLYSRISMTLGPGTYYARVEEFGNNDIINTYYLNLTVTYTTPVLDIYEPDNSYPEAKTIISGVQQTHSINPAGDNDWVTFTLTDYANIILETSGSGGDDTVLYFYDSTGTNQIGYDDDGGSNLYSRISMTLGPGTYYARVIEYGNDNIIHSYYLNLTVIYTNTPTISPTHSISPTFTNSGTITPTSTISPTHSISATFTISPTVSATCTPLTLPTMGIDWVLATGNANFTPRYGHTGAVFNGKMWIIGGLDDSFITHNDIWSSNDGINWIQETAAAGFSPRAFHSTVTFNGKLWVIGGIDIFSMQVYNDVWSSSDGINWVQETVAAAFSPRYCHTSVVFNNRIWVIGGTNTVGGYFNDVWSSADGINWTQETSSAGFSPRYGLSSAVLNGKLFIFNGYDINYNYLNDVWSSNNGINWIQEKASTAYTERISNGLIYYNGLLWMIGGYNGSVFLNDVWVSPDGINWTQLSSSTNFTPRAAFELLFYSGRLWVIAGSDSMGPTTNDVWYSPPGPLYTSTISPTYSVTRTFTITPTITGTPSTSTNTPTYTSSFTSTPTWTVTQTIPTPTNTPTNTPAPEEPELVIKNIRIYPHPYNPKSINDLRIRYYVTQHCSEVRIKIYSASFRLILNETIEQNIDAGLKISTLGRETLSRLANGIYYFVIEAKGKDGKIRSRPEYLVILK